MVQFVTLPSQGGDQRQVAEVVRGMMDGKTNNTGTVTLSTGWATTTTIYNERIGYESSIFLIPINATSGADCVPYGAFQDTSTQSIASTTTAYPMTFNTTDYTSGVYIGSPTSRIYVRSAGIYNLQFSSQIENTDTAIHDVDIWLRKNGTNVSGTNGKVAVPNSHGGTSGHILPAWNYFIDLLAGEYVELVLAAASTQVAMTFLAAQTSPTRPATASVIATMHYVSPSASTNVYVSARTKGSATLTHFANDTADKKYGYIVVG